MAEADRMNRAEDALKISALEEVAEAALAYRQSEENSEGDPEAAAQARLDLDVALAEWEKRYK